MCAAADLSDCRLVCSITPAGMDVKGGGKAAVHRSAVRLNPKFCVNSQRGENRAEFNVCGSGFIRLPLVCSITPAGMDVKGGGKAAVHRSAAQRRADP